MTSKFKFSNPGLTKLNFQINNDYEGSTDSEPEIGISISHGINKTKENEADVELSIEVGELSNQVPFYVSLTIGAKFKLDGTIDGTDFDRLLEVNAPALLFSYARPIISSVTNQAGIKPLNLPFVNFTYNVREKDTD